MATVYITAPETAAEDIASALVEERFAACVNAVPCTSTYRWEGEIHDDGEVILLAKTDDDAVGDLTDRVEQLHPYDVPCIEVFEESSVLAAFADWREAATERSG